MNVLTKIPLFALLVGSSWFILFLLIVVSHNHIVKQPCQLDIKPKNGTIVMKSENDTTNYYDSEKKGECLCDNVKCVRRCCMGHQKYSKGRCIDGVAKKNLSAFFPYYITENVTLDKMCLQDMKYTSLPINFTIGKAGKLLADDNSELKHDEYCLIRHNLILVCYKEKQNVSLTIGMIISMPFLLVTFLVYLILPERNVHRRALINYVFSLLCGYIALVTIQLFTNGDSPLENVKCHLIGYAIVFFFIVSFFWMNVICIDMWLAFSGLRGFSGRKNAEKKKFILFCIYAWGMPALLILLIFLMNTYADGKAIYHPKLGVARCFLEEGYPNLFYFYLPMAILITVNVILCILTAVKIQKAKKETSMLKQGDSKRHSYENDRQKFKLYLKLIFAMGINWSMEVISWIIIWQWHDVPLYVWYLTDFTNAAYGVFIFFIFVFKKNVWVQLKKRYYVLRGQPHLAHTLSSTQTTRTSNLSTAETTTVSSDYRLNDLRNGRMEEKPLSVH